ncbi:hypothetical protein [Streptomyces sp. NPDC001851]|uniref:hypothetical protein n=1 Tax=Streptomyces sp. NPDC001851 TaxID=3154529 RepID=UPI0033342601
MTWRPADMLSRSTPVAGTDRFFWLHTVLYRALAVLLQEAGFRVEFEDLRVMHISRSTVCG